MIVGCYTLDLYCDNADPPNAHWVNGKFKSKFGHEWREFPHTYSGASRAACARKARKDGWLIVFKSDHREARALCPKCKKGKR